MCKILIKKGDPDKKPVAVGDADKAVCAKLGVQHVPHHQHLHWLTRFSPLVNDGLTLEQIREFSAVCSQLSIAKEVDKDGTISGLSEVAKALAEEFEVVQDPRCDGNCHARQLRALMEGLCKSMEADPDGTTEWIKREAEKAAQGLVREASQEEPCQDTTANRMRSFGA
jgi:hypothetical protein